METKNLTVELRSKTGKGICRQLRVAGRVPAIIYGKGMDSVPVSINLKELTGALNVEGGRIITLKGPAGLDGLATIVSGMDRTALNGKIRHVDLHKVNMAEKVRAEVKINLVGTAKGVKDGGILDFALHRVEVECLPALIPGHIDVDITNVALGRSLHVSELNLPADLKVITDPKATVVTVLGKTREETPAAQ